MTSSGCLLIDTSVWVEALRNGGDQSLRNAVQVALHENRAAMTAPIWVELYRGVRGKKEMDQLAAVRRLCRWLEFDEACWEKTAETARSCREKGATVPLSDLMVHACARRHGVDLLERDEHFSLISQAVGKTP